MAAVVNARSLFGRISGTFIAEYLQVSTQSTIDGNYYYAELSEAPGDFPDVPADIIVSTSGDRTVTTAHLKRRTGGSVGPQKGEYRLEAQRVYFPASQAGLSYWFFYYGIGDYIKAEDINQLDTRVTTLEQGGVSPAGNHGDIQFNNNPVLGASSLLNWDIDNERLTIGGLARLRISNGASDGKVLTSDATGDASWQDAPGAIPADPDGSVQFNDSGDLGGSSQFMWNSGTNVLTLGASSGLSLLFGNPAANKVLTSDGSGNASWASVPVSSPGGPNGSIQYNNGGAFDGIGGTTYDSGNNRLDITNNLRINAGAPPSIGQFLTATSSDGDVAWGDIPDTTPSGTNGQVQFNDNGAFAGAANLTYSAVRTTISGNLRISGGAPESNKVLTSTNASGDVVWSDLPEGITVGGSLNTIQTNDGSGGLSGDANLTFNGTLLDLNGTFQYTDGNEGAGKYLRSDEFGNASWQTIPAVLLPGGSDGQIQFNDNGSFGGSASIEYSSLTSTITIADNLRLNITTPAVGRFLRCTNVNGSAEWADITMISPGGSDSQIQYNDGGSFSGAANLTYNASLTTIAGNLRISGGTPAANRFLTSTNASGDVSWVDLPTGLTPGGTANTIQTNNGSGALSGSVNLTFDGTLLDLNGTFQYTDGNEGDGKYLRSDASGNASWQSIPPVLLPGGGSDGNIQFKADTDAFGGSDNLNWDNGSSLLLVVGTIQYQNGNQADGRILTSSATGVSDWIDPAWVISTDDISFGYNGTVNIGTFVTLPTMTPKLNVDGRIVLTNDLFVMNADKSLTANLRQNNTDTEYYIPPTTGGLPTGAGNILAYTISQSGGFDIDLNTSVRRLDVDSGITDGGVRVGNPTDGAGFIHINTLANDSDNDFIKNSILMSRDGDFTFDLGTSMWTIGNTSGSNDFAAMINRVASLSFYVGNAGAFTSISNADFRNEHEMLTITPTGVGVNGVITPSVSLEVNGETRLQDLRIDNGSAGAGKILSSTNSDGDTVWIDPLTSSGSSGDIQFSDGLGEFSSSSNLRWISASSTLVSSGNISVGKTTAPTLSSGSSSNAIEIESSSNPGVIFTSTTPSDNQVFLHYNSAANNFQLYNTNTSTTLFSVDNFGRFSLGTSVPVSSYISGARNFVIEDTTSFCGMTLGSSSSFGTQILFSNTANRGSVLGAIQYFNNTNHLEFTSNGSEAMRCNNAQEVVMTTRVVTPALRVTTSPSAGHVLTSDASGNATWQAPNSSGYSPGSWSPQSTPTGWTGTILYRYDSTRGTVEFQGGSIQYNSGSQTTLMTLPVGQRPFFQQFIQLRDQSTGSDLDMVVVNTDGTVVVKTFPEIGNNLTIQGVIYTTIA